MKDGAARLLELVQEAKALPIKGLMAFSDYKEKIWNYYLNTDPAALGVSTGWDCVDSLYKVVPGEVTIVTGIPNSGKSEFIDALLVNLAEMHNWTFLLCSMEKAPHLHAKQLIEKRMRKPFRGMLWDGTPRDGLSETELMGAMAWLEDHFYLCRYTEEDSVVGAMAPKIEWVLTTAKAAVMRYGIRGLVIDPYNELDTDRPNNVTETAFVSRLMSQIKAFAQQYNVHVWFVAHPRQLQNHNGEPPGMYSISGSANFMNKADNGIVVHRRFSEVVDPATGRKMRKAQRETEILVRKVRNSAAGMQGDTYLVYDRPTGRYEDPKPTYDIRPDDPKREIIYRNKSLGFFPLWEKGLASADAAGASSGGAAAANVAGGASVAAGGAATASGGNAPGFAGGPGAAVSAAAVSNRYPTAAGPAAAAAAPLGGSLGNAAGDGGGGGFIVTEETLKFVERELKAALKEPTADGSDDNDDEEEEEEEGNKGEEGEKGDATNEKERPKMPPSRLRAMQEPREAQVLERQGEDPDAKRSTEGHDPGPEFYNEF